MRQATPLSPYKKKLCNTMVEEETRTLNIGLCAASTIWTADRACAEGSAVVIAYL